jgi:2,4-didehydro-3-deoxy-L-rhamnonate hydrolase
MKVARFNGDRLGVIRGDSIIDVTYTVKSPDACDWPPPPGDRVVHQLGAIREAAATGGRTHPLDGVTLHSPVTTPTKVMAAPANYRKHIEIDAADPAVHHGVHNVALEGLATPVESLGLFLKAGSSLAGPADGIRLPRLDRRTDHEVELAAVIGREGRHIAAADAASYVAGYCVGLDVSIRGKEDRSFRKSADTFTVLGPWLTTADEIEDPEDLTLWLRVDGEERQRSSTAAMTVGLARLIELASAHYTLHPGDVLMTGTPEGVGPLEPGNVVEAGCTGLGSMRVEVAG